METQQNRYLEWLKYRWMQLGAAGGVLITFLALIGGYNDILQFLKNVNTDQFDPMKMSCSLSSTEIMTNTAPTFKAQLDSDTYKIGDILTMQLLPNSDAYFTVIDHGSDPNDPPRKKVLFLNKYAQKDNVFSLPRPNTGFLEVFEPAGKNTFEIIASSAPIDDPAGYTRNVAFREFAKGKIEKIQQSNNCTLTFNIIDK